LIDQLGSESDAFNQAASRAHLWHYQVGELYSLAGLSSPSYPLGFFLQTKEGMQLPYPSRPGLYMLYIPTLPVEQK
jgi:hypothetical protein